MKNNTIDAKLLNARVAIDNALENAFINMVIAAFGYDNKKLQEGKALYETVQALHSQQKKKYGEQYAATDELETALSSANKDYIMHLKIARIALRTHRSAAEALQLGGRRKGTHAGWVQQATLFYGNVLASSDIKTALAAFGIDEKKLKAGQTAVRKVQTLLTVQHKEKGEAQAATQARDEALETLMDWLRDFFAISRIALADDPQMLEMLGIVVAS